MLQPILSNIVGKRIILASGSPRRREILDRIVYAGAFYSRAAEGLHFEVIPSTFEENLDKSLFTPEEYVKETARRKALEVAERLKGSNAPELIIGADTVVALGDKIFEKPSSESSAFDMLSELNGKSHKVHTGVVLLTSQSVDNHDETFRITQFCETTEVQFGDLSPEIIRGYVSTGEPMDKAGGYGLQALGGSLVKGIVGDYFNVVGFPLHHFCTQLVKLYS